MCVLACLLLGGGCGDGQGPSGGDGLDDSEDVTVPPGTPPPSDLGEVNRGEATGCGPLEDRIRTVEPSLPTAAVASSEYHPVVLSPAPGGGSLLGWRQAGAQTLHVARLGAQADNPELLLSVPGEEIHALTGHGNGGALVRILGDPDIYSAQYCRGPSTPDEPMCAQVQLLRFDDGGDVLFQNTLTEKHNVNTAGALFVWWYHHTARLVWADDRYGVYFRSAMSTARPDEEGEVDIHAGDTLRFVSADGERMDGGWDWGCSHSWSVRLAHSGEHFGAACHGDAFPNAHRLRILAPGSPTALLHEGTEPTERALGGLVGDDGSFWLNYLQMAQGNLALQLARIDADAQVERDEVVEAATDLDDEYVFRAYMERFGHDLLLGWKSDNQLHLAIADGASGELLEGPVVTDAPIDDYVDFVAYPNGDVGWAHSSGGEQGVTVTRVAACP